jgi:hypothetical protein
VAEEPEDEKAASAMPAMGGGGMGGMM